ncbi:MAG: trypsin-like peptidase domain-containing protein, partial [Desulfobacterales bacterium]|nr:trypsin-like peptidase domain-containing protein [Desulfobacterales bacterium]
MEAYLITRYLVMQSWQIAVLTIAVALAAFALKSRSAHIRYFLWLIVLAKCLVPPFYMVPLGVLPREKLDESPSVIPSPKALTMVSETLDPGVPQSRPAALKKVDLPRIDVKPAEAPKVSAISSAPAPARFHVIQWLGIAWMVGAGAYLAVNLLKVLRANYWLWTKRSILPTKLQKDIENLLFAYGFKRFPKIWLMDSFSQPFVWGLLRGSIYLPTNFLNIKKPEHQKSILGHELSHVVRFDAAVNLLQILAQAIFWFHSLVWWANKKIRAEREKCCDEMVIARLGAKAKDYSMAIVETLAARSESTRPVPSLAVVGPAKNIEERIRSMLKPGKKFYKRPSLTAAVILLLFALLTAATGFVLTASEEKTQLGSLEQKIAVAAKKAKRSVVRISWSNDSAKVEKSYSGVILTAEGYVATCVPYPERRDLSPGKVVSIHLADGRRVPGIVVGSSQEWHFDLMKITQPGSWPHAEIGSSVKLKAGEMCLALGYPQPTRVGKLPYDREPSLRVGRTTTMGLARWLGTSCRIDTSGDNGGGLFDLQGRLIGIHALYNVKEQMAMHWTIEIIQQHWKEMTGL